MGAVCWDEVVREAGRSGLEEEGEQLALVRAGAPKRRARPAAQLAVDRPVAGVVVDMALAHLDRAFDYSVPAELSDVAAPGVRVRVRFAGRDVDGFVVDRRDATDHAGRLSPLRRVVSGEQVLSSELLGVARRVADHYAGTLADVLRLAVPPRHARAEAEQLGGTTSDRPLAPLAPPAGERWRGYEHGPQLLAALATGGSPRAVWAALGGSDPVLGRWPRWPGDLAEAVRACVASGRGALVVVPDGRDVGLVGAALEAELGPGCHVALTADLGPEERYRRWLAVLRGSRRVVVGTRAAAFAPVADLGLVAIWDDGDDVHAEPRAPYPHAREVLLMRADQVGASVLVGGFAVTAESAELVRSGWARAVRPVRAAARAAAPLVRVTGADGDSDRHAPTSRVRLPGLAFEAARAGLGAGPVLVQVPRAGYVPALACARCRTPARCPRCRGPLELSAAGRAPACRWCGRAVAQWRCEECESPSLRAPVVGAGRTAEELGRAFPSVPVVSSGGSRVVTTVGARPALVVATTGAEPVADGGYAAGLLLDGWLLLGRADLRAGEEALRRWLAAAALVRPAADGGRLVLMAPPGARAVQALVRSDPFGAAERELADRVSARFPPAVAAATLTGDASAIAELLALAQLPEASEVLGPVALADDEQRFVLRSPRPSRDRLATALQIAMAVRSSRKSPGTVRVQLDPLDLG